MMKHLGNPQERWWEVDHSLFTQTDWMDLFASVYPTGFEQAMHSPLSEDAIRNWVNTLYCRGFEKEKAHWLAVYRDVYTKIANRAIEQSLETGYGLKTISSVYLGSRNVHVYTDCVIAPSGLVVFLETTRTLPVHQGFPKQVRSVFRPAPTVDVPAWCIADYYKFRSDVYAKRFDLQLPETVGGWNLGDRTDQANLSTLRKALATKGEVVGRGLIGFGIDVCSKA